jgi:hypothetical protein
MMTEGWIALGLLVALCAFLVFALHKTQKRVEKWKVRAYSLKYTDRLDEFNKVMSKRPESERNW